MIHNFFERRGEQIWITFVYNIYTLPGEKLWNLTTLSRINLQIYANLFTKGGFVNCKKHIIDSGWSLRFVFELQRMQNVNAKCECEWFYQHSEWVGGCARPGSTQMAALLLLFFLYLIEI